ncbi:MAG: isocitrate lyase/PEP mutase family protein [Anderseniella sp.]|jgi:2-methylisocitrate lyase-like PEP mutase family enzyme|nr:isocitrate lyase/PEP mutase family protein [Anderseniella sp.]
MTKPSQAQRLREILSEDTCHVMPCCWDGLSAKMIGDAGFRFSFMSGFAVSASRIGAPDTGLISFGEMLDQGRNICAATDIPIIGDGDTGYGNALNVRRTVEMYARAGFAAVMIEDQVAPKRCGHTKGKLVVDRAEAFNRIKAAVDAKEAGADILILARTDARHGHGLDEAIDRAKGFSDLGADMLFVEAPQSEAEMARLTREAPGIHMANLVEGGATPILHPDRLHELGYRFAAYPLTLLSATMKAIQDALAVMARREHPADLLLEFADLRKAAGFDAYYAAEQAYSDSRD